MEDPRERRRDNRIPVTLAVEWARPGQEPETAELGDLSRHGCFVLSTRPPTKGELIELRLLTEGRRPRLRGRVAYSMEIGFGVRFIGLRASARRQLDGAVAAHYAALEEVTTNSAVQPPPTAVGLGDGTAQVGSKKSARGKTPKRKPNAK